MEQKLRTKEDWTKCCKCKQWSWKEYYHLKTPYSEDEEKQYLCSICYCEEKNETERT